MKPWIINIEDTLPSLAAESTAKFVMKENMMIDLLRITGLVEITHDRSRVLRRIEKFKQHLISNKDKPSNTTDYSRIAKLMHTDEKLLSASIERLEMENAHSGNFARIFPTVSTHANYSRYLPKDRGANQVVAAYIKKFYSPTRRSAPKVN